MLSKLAIGLLALASLFGLSKPANAQGYWGMYDSGYAWLYHPTDTIPFYYPPYYPYWPYYPYLAYYPYSPYYPYLAYYPPYYPGFTYGWSRGVSWRR